MAFASGKNAWGISDRSGFRYRLREMKREWTGALVGPDEYEPKHPQLYPVTNVSDPQALRDPRPEQDLAQQRSIQYGWNPVGFKALPGLTPPSVLAATGQVGTVSVSGTSINVAGLAASGTTSSVAISTGNSTISVNGTSFARGRVGIVTVVI